MRFGALRSVGLATLALFLYAAGAAAATGPVEIRIGHGLASEEQLWLMLARPDLTPNQGKAYTLKFTAFRGNADRLNAYEAGQIDGGTIAAPTALFAAEQGVPLRLVASVCREVTGGKVFNSTFLALADSGIATAKDLKGKAIGIVDFKSATDLWARAAMETAGLDAGKDVNYAVLPFPAMGEALRSKRIAAGVFVQPFYTIEKNKGGVVDVFTSKTGVPFDEELLLLFLRPEFVDKNAAAVKAFLSDFVATAKWYQANTKAGRQALIDKQMVRTPPAIYLEMSDFFRDPTGRVNVDGMRRQQELLLKLGWMSKTVDLAKLVDQSLLPQ